VELRFHPQVAGVAESGGYLSRGRKAVLRVEELTTGDAEVTAGDMAAKDMLRPAKAVGLDKLEDPHKLYTIKLESKKPEWRNAVALSWSAAGREPARVRLEKKGDEWIFHAGTRAVALKWDGSVPRATE